MASIKKRSTTKSAAKITTRSALFVLRVFFSLHLTEFDLMSFLFYSTNPRKEFRGWIVVLSPEESHGVLIRACQDALLRLFVLVPAGFLERPFGTRSTSPGCHDRPSAMP
jgi:hypothetical protein